MFVLFGHIHWVVCEETIKGAKPAFALFAECPIAFTVEKGHGSIICTQVNISDWATNNVVHDSEGAVAPDELVTQAIIEEYGGQSPPPILSFRVMGEMDNEKLGGFATCLNRKRPIVDEGAACWCMAGTHMAHLSNTQDDDMRVFNVAIADGKYLGRNGVDHRFACRMQKSITILDKDYRDFSQSTCQQQHGAMSMPLKSKWLRRY